MDSRWLLGGSKLHHVGPLMTDDNGVSGEHLLLPAAGRIQRPQDCVEAARFPLIQKPKESVSWNVRIEGLRWLKHQTYCFF